MKIRNGFHQKPDRANHSNWPERDRRPWLPRMRGCHFRNLKGTPARNEFGHTPVRIAFPEKGFTIHCRNQDKSLKSVLPIDGLPPEMSSNAGEIFHQTLWVFENLGIDSLQSVAIGLLSVPAKNQEGIVHVSISMRFKGGKRSINSETTADSFNGMIG